MNRFRSFFLTATTLLFVSACSTPADLTTPTLAPQFGTADDDIGIDVATVSSGRVYSLSQQSGPFYDDTSNRSGDYGKVFLKRQDSSGKVIWSQEIGSALCAPYPDYLGNDCGKIRAVSLVADAQGNINALTAHSYAGTSMDVDYHSVGYSIRRYNASGQVVSEIHLSDDDDYWGSAPQPISFMIDGSGNIYVARVAYARNEDAEVGTYTNVVAKYSASGTLQWQRTSTVGTPKDITVSGSGSVYVAGSTGIARYTNSGGLTWTKPGNFEEVTISGSNLYTRYRKDIRKYDGTGKQLWLKSQSGLSTMVFQDMDGDGSGNVYLSGKYDADSSSKLNMNAMVRKLNSSGTVLFTKTYGTPAYDDALGIATISGSEIYVTGETQGSLAHTNRGGPENRDGYLRKLSSSGNPVWTR